MSRERNVFEESMELDEVVTDAHEEELAFDLGHASQIEAAKSKVRF